MADSPAREEARYDLFEAAAGVHSDHFALAALEGTPNLPAPARYQRPQENAEEENATQEEAEKNNEQPQAAAQFAPMPSLERRARIAFEAAEVLERLGRLNESLPYLETARKLEKAPQRRKLIIERIAAVRRELRRQRLNQARQPILHEALEQNRLVRPRIPLATAAVPEEGEQRP